MSTIIEAKNLNLWYGAHHALHDVNIEIPEHEITALIGPSGCGKSTFLKTLNRMNDLVEGIRIEGEINYGGQNIYDPGVDTTWLRKQIGMVFQKANPFPMSIYDNVAYGPRTHGIRSKVKLDEIVEESLRGAAIWDEVKDRLKKSAWACPAASSSACASPGPWPSSRTSCSWTSPPPPWTPSPLLRSKILPPS